MRKRTTSPGGRLMDLRTAAAYLGCSYWTLRDLVLNGHIPAVRITSPRARDGRVMRRILIDSRDLERLIERRKEVGDSAPRLNGRSNSTCRDSTTPPWRWSPRRGRSLWLQMRARWQDFPDAATVVLFHDLPAFGEFRDADLKTPQRLCKGTATGGDSSHVVAVVDNAASSDAATDGSPVPLAACLCASPATAKSSLK